MTAFAGAVLGCSACQADVEPGQSTCASCGSPVFPPARRLVTVLFVDLTGYTALSARFDVEDVHNLVRPVMNSLRMVCEGLEGVVAGIEGDGFMAVFGAMAATEDDPRRAVLAAVEMQRLLRDRARGGADTLPPLRVGINVGEALVAPSWERSGFSVSGDVVNVASRLCHECAPGGVLASADLVRFVPLSRAWGDVLPRSVRNRDELVLTRELEWTSLDRPELTEQVSSAREYVSRPRLEEQVRRAVREGRSLQVLGEAGIGKSRLVAAVLDDGIDGRVVGRAGFPAFGRDGRTWAELVEDLWSDPVAVAYRALPVLDRRRVDRLRGAEVDTSEVDTFHEQLQAFRGLVHAVALIVPVTLCLEDAHWAGDDELAFLEQLVVGTGRGRIGLLLTSRHQVASTTASLQVPPLEGAELDEHLAGLLPGLSPQVRAVLLERAGGSPFYLEHCADLLVEEGAVAQTERGWELVDPERLRRIPVVMRQFLSARIDSLAADQQLVLRTAAVLGDAIDVGLLSYLCGRGLDLAAVVGELIERRLLEQRQGVEPYLAFRHQLLRDVAYEGLLKSQRVAIHLAAAEWYSVLPVVQLLASEVAHLEAAIALGEPDCDLIRRAVEVLTQFGLTSPRSAPPRHPRRWTGPTRSYDSTPRATSRSWSCSSRGGRSWS